MQLSQERGGPRAGGVVVSRGGRVPRPEADLWRVSPRLDPHKARHWGAPFLLTGGLVLLGDRQRGHLCQAPRRAVGTSQGLVKKAGPASAQRGFPEPGPEVPGADGVSGRWRALLSSAKWRSGEQLTSGGGRAEVAGPLPTALTPPDPELSLLLSPSGHAWLHWRHLQAMTWRVPSCPS